MKMVESQTVLRDGHYEVCLPLRNASSPMPNNRALALQRLNGLKKKFRNDTFRQKHTDFIEDLFVKDHASRIPEEELSRDDGQVWYLPHHGVIHPHKDKLRVVLDASASFAGTSLNACLLSGPDLSSSLFGVLVRFRQEQVAFVTDLECMFYQVKVPLHQRDLLRFLWWPENKWCCDAQRVIQRGNHRQNASSGRRLLRNSQCKTVSLNWPKHTKSLSCREYVIIKVNLFHILTSLCLWDRTEDLSAVADPPSQVKATPSCQVS